jgi:hypothetical protein
MRNPLISKLAVQDGCNRFPFLHHINPAVAAARCLLKNKAGAVLTGRKRGMEKGHEYHGDKDDGPSKQRPRRRSPKSAPATLTPPFCFAVLELVSRLQ